LQIELFINKYRQSTIVYFSIYDLSKTKRLQDAITFNNDNYCTMLAT